MAASVNYKVPPVFTEQKPYCRWIDEIKAWKALTDLDKKKIGIAIALPLPEEGLNSIRDKVFSDLSLEALNADDGPMLAFKLLEYSELEMTDQQLVFTGVNYDQFESLFKQMATSLKKIFGQQASKDMGDRIRVESACMANEDVNYSRNCFGRGRGFRGNQASNRANQLKIDINFTTAALVATQMTKDKTKIIEKLHKQFAHPSAKRLKNLLKDVGGYTKEHLDCVDEITEGCDVCKKYKKTPARPVVSLPLATEFNEVVAVD
ncbi:unnamed protein product [Mytilus coruscus]|uniref:Uncharacterized protein n=1 Tax=Mytilus coruscus TaxID=42192 RepID=A0A6J8E3G8_MYTCO|nr:unnamed protein product [Mytilus coruscus]